MGRSSFPLVVMMALLFIAFGSALPEPVGEFSTQTRTGINRFVIGLFPESGPRLRPNERTERQLQEASSH